MYCPECGHNADEAKFCPECGTDLTAASQALRGRAKKSTAAAPVRAQRPRTARRAADRLGEPAPARRSRSVLWIWLGFAAIAVVVVAVVVIAGSGSGNGPAAPAAGPVAADTSGSYTELVGRGNDLYDQGITAFGTNDDAGGVEYFKAAAAVYRAAWKKQPGDPSVGTDLAVALFYSQHHDEALKQIAVVLKKDPTFQPGHLNKGIFLQTEASEAKDSGDPAKGADFLAQAKIALEKAVSLDPTSEAGKHAAEQLKSL
jgi:tetratricopeptide (TPR) repeat protein